MLINFSFEMIPFVDAQEDLDRLKRCYRFQKDRSSSINMYLLAGTSDQGTVGVNYIFQDHFPLLSLC